jgi:hypothetical protein
MKDINKTWRNCTFTIMKKMVKYCISDLKKMKTCLEQQLEDLKLEVFKVDECFKRVNNVIQSANKSNDDTEILLPENFLCPQTVTLNDNRKKVKWRELAIEVISKSNSLLNSQMIYNKGRVSFALQFINERDCKKSLSSALSILVDEGKIGKFKDQKSKRLFLGIYINILLKMVSLICLFLIKTKATELQLL